MNQDLITELQRSYLFFVEHFFPTELHLKEKIPVFVVASRGRKAVNGWFWANRWKSKTNTETIAPEIFIAAESLSRNPEDVLETLLHEIAHYKNFLAEIKDCNSAQYHNKHFKKTAEQLGLEVSKLSGRGYARTALGPLAKEAIEKLKPNTKCYDLFRLEKEQRPTIKKYISALVSIEQQDTINKIRNHIGDGASTREVLEYALNVAEMSLSRNAE